MISCKDYVAYAKGELKEKIEKLKTKPRLVVIQVDDDPASNSYIKGKRKDCEEVGIEFIHKRINSDIVSQIEFEDMVSSESADPKVNGIIIQLPIPEKYDLERLKNCIVPNKDVDGFRVDSEFKSCTPKGIIDWFEFNEINLQGKDVVVIGRSDIVGKPLVNMFIEKGATVTCCNSKTENIKYYTRNVDIVVSAIGKPKHFDSKYFKQGQVIIDVGINRDENGKLCGDVDSKYIYDSYVTPVPGGVGLLTRISLLQNVYVSYMNDTL